MRFLWLSVCFSELDKVIRYLTQHPQISVRLSGHTDDVGKSKYNLILSAQRAESAAEYLISNGIDAGRIFTAGYGETKALVRKKSRCRNKNRRVEIEFYE